MADSYYREKFYSAQDIPAPKNLIQGLCHCGVIEVSTTGEYEYATLMMSSDGKIFDKATADGLRSAESVCILSSHNLVVENGEVHQTAGYFGGVYDKDSLVLAYETEEDSHEELINAIEPVLRKFDIYLK